MPPPRALPAAAAPVKTRDICDLCAQECCGDADDEDVVEVVCNQAACVDGRGSLYHRSCLLKHIDKSGAVRKTHGGKADMRQILRMDLTGAPCAARAKRFAAPRVLCFLRGRLARRVASAKVYVAALTRYAPRPRPRAPCRLLLHPVAARAGRQEALRARARQRQHAQAEGESRAGGAARGCGAGAAGRAP
jgi:hypothetical protein